jgi:hypothetical protein
MYRDTLTMVSGAATGEVVETAAAAAAAAATVVLAEPHVPNETDALRVPSTAGARTDTTNPIPDDMSVVEPSTHPPKTDGADVFANPKKETSMSAEAAAPSPAPVPGTLLCDNSQSKPRGRKSSPFSTKHACKQWSSKGICRGDEPVIKTWFPQDCC